MIQYELEVTVNSMGVPRPVLFYYPPDQLVKGLSDLAKAYGHFDQWTVVITKIYPPAPGDNRENAQ